MRKLLLVLCILLVLASASFAVTVSNASLKGKYSFQLTSSHFDSWSTSITCYDPQGNPYTAWAGGSENSSESVVGVMTFDGKGNVMGTYTQYGKFDQNASNATAVPSCSGSGSNGYAVYDPPAGGTLTGTYSIQPTGLGAMVISVSGGGDSPNFVLELAGTAAIRTTVYMTQFDPTTNRVEVAGSAILQ